MAGTYYYPSPSPASGAYPDYYPSGSSAACSPHSPSFLTPYGTSSSGYQVLTPSTSGSSLPTTPANGSPITGQKRRLRPSPSPPPMTAAWSDLYYAPSSTKASTVSPVDNSPLSPLYFSAPGYQQASLEYPSAYNDDFASLFPTTSSGSASPHSPYGNISQFVPQTPVRRSSRPLTTAEPVVVAASPRPHSPVGNISKLRHAPNYLIPGLFPDDRVQHLAALGTASYEHTVPPYTIDYTSPHAHAAPKPAAPPAHPRIYQGGVKFKQPIVATASYSAAAPSYSSLSSPIEHKKRRTEAAPTYFVPHVSHSRPSATSLVQGAVVPQGRYSSKAGVAPGPTLRTISFGRQGVRLHEMIRDRAHRERVLLPSTPDAGLAWLHEVYKDRDGQRRQRDALTFRVLWPGGDPKHSAFVSLAVGRDGKARVTLPDLAERVALAVKKYFAQTAKSPPQLVDPVAQQWAIGARVQFEDLVLTRLEQVTQGSWQAVLIYQPAPSTAYIAESGVSRTKSRK